MEYMRGVGGADEDGTAYMRCDGVGDGGRMAMVDDDGMAVVVGVR